MGVCGQDLTRLVQRVESWRAGSLEAWRLVNLADSLS